MHLLLVEDEAAIARRIERLTRDILGERLDRLVVKDRLEAALDYVRQQPIDLLLLDLNLSGKNGFDLLRNVVAESFPTIIISAYRDRALEAFEYGVLDFVPKPFDRERLEKALQRVIDRSSRNEVPGKYLAIKKPGRVELVPVDAILFIQGANIYAEIHLLNGRKELSDKNLEALYQILPPAFARIHKSYIVNMRQAAQLLVRPGSRYELQLRDGRCLPVGRTRYAGIREAFFS